MQRCLKRGLLLASLLPCLGSADVAIENLSAQGYIELGSIVDGNFGGNPVSNQYLSRLGTNITANDTVQGRLKLTIGVGGVYWQPLPVGDFWQKSLKFAPQITQASAEALFRPGMSLEMGFFPYKYNSSAVNLGEYLMRGEAYPSYVTTGGWIWVDSASTQVLGARLKASHFEGKFRHELGVYLEFRNAPVFDITPAYLFSWQPATGIEIGGGIALKRWFTPSTAQSGEGLGDAAATKYVTVGNFPEVQNQAEVLYTYDDGTGNRVNGHSFAVWSPAGNLDTAALLSGKTGATVTGVQMIQEGSVAGSRTGIKKFLENLAGCSADSSQCTPYWGSDTSNISSVDGTGATVAGSGAAAQITNSVDITRRAINLMGRVAFDFSKMMGVEDRIGSFKLYAELAVLGLQNQPVYYQSVAQRMPVMAGINIPTFGVLDNLTVETEYFNNPYIDSHEEFAGQPSAPLQGRGDAIPDIDYKQRMFNLPSVHGDDWKWSVSAVRTIIPGLKLKILAANDHLRAEYFDVDGLAGAFYGTTAPSPQTATLSDWYFVTHLQWGF